MGARGQGSSLGLGELALWGSATHHAEGTECRGSAPRGSSSLLRRTEITSKQLAGLELVGRPPSSRWVSECRESRVGVWGSKCSCPLESTLFWLERNLPRPTGERASVLPRIWAVGAPELWGLTSSWELSRDTSTGYEPVKTCHGWRGRKVGVVGRKGH